jgi:hypothetical protein
MVPELDPQKVFDAPVSDIQIAYIDLEKFAHNPTNSHANNTLDNSEDDLTPSTNPDRIGCDDGIATHTISTGEMAGVDATDRVSFALQKLFTPAVFEEFKQTTAQATSVTPIKPYNVLSNSRLALKGVQESEAEVIIKLTGKVIIGGVCDSPRVNAQLERTIAPLFPGKKVSILIDSVPLEKMFRER